MATLDPELGELTAAAEQTSLTPEERAQFDKPGIVSGGLRAGLYGTIGAGAETLGFQGAADSLSEAASKLVDPTLQDYRNVTDAGSLGRYVLAQGAQAVGSTAPTLIPGLGGAGVAGRLAMGLRAGRAATTAARTAGGAAAGYGAALPVEMGETLQEARRIGMDTSEETVRQVAWDKALINAGLEAAMPAILGGKLLKGFSKKILGTAAIEGATEGAQEVSGLFAKSRLTGQPVDFADPNVRAQLVNAVVGGAVGGGAISVPIGALEAVGDAKMPSVSLGKAKEATTQLFKDAAGKTLNSTNDLYKSAKGYIAEAAGLAPTTEGEMAGPAKTAYDEIFSQAQTAAAQGGGAFEALRTSAMAKYAGADREVRNAVSSALLRGSLGNLYDEINQQAQAAIGAGKEAVTALQEKYKDARPDAKAALAQALASGAPKNVAATAAGFVNTVTEQLKRVADPEQRGILLDTAAAKVASMRDSVTDWAKGLAGVVTNESNISQNPKQQTDLFGEAPERIAAYLGGAEWFPRSIKDAENAAAFMTAPASRAKVAQAIYESLPAEYREKIANPVFNDGVTQAVIGGLFAEYSARSRMTRLADIIDNVRAKFGGAEGAQRSDALTQADLNLASMIEQELRASLASNMMTAMMDKGPTGKRAAKQAENVRERTEQLNPVVPTHEATLQDLAKQYALALREVFTIQSPTGPQAGPAVLPTDEVIALYQDLADVFDNHEPALEILEQAKGMYGSEMDLDAIDTIGTSDRDLVQAYALVDLDERQASRVAHAIEMFLAGVPMRDQEALRLVNVAFGGQPQRFADLATRIAANHRGAATYGSRAAEAFVAPREAVAEGEVTTEEAEAAAIGGPAAQVEQEEGRLAEGFQEETPQARVSFGFSKAFIPATDTKAVEGQTKQLQEQFPDIKVEALPLSALNEDDTNGVEPIDYITSFLEQSQDKRAAKQLAEIGNVMDDPQGLIDVLNKYVFFRFGEGQMEENLSPRQYSDVKAQATDKGSAEQGTLTLLDETGKRQVFSAVALVNAMIRNRGVGGTGESLPMNIQRALSAGVGALVGRTSPTGFVALQSPQKIDAGKVPTPFAPTRSREDYTERTRPDPELLLSNIVLGGSDKTMTERLLDWAAGKVKVSSFDKKRGTRIPDASINFGYGDKNYTLDISSSFMQIREGDKVVGGPVIRPDLLVYSPARGGKRLLWRDVQVKPEPASLGEYMSKGAKERAGLALTKQIDSRLGRAQAKLVRNSKDANAKRLVGILNDLKGRQDPVKILDEMSAMPFDELEMHPLYTVYESIMADIGPSIANAAWRQYQQQEQFTYESGDATPETEIVEGEEGPQAKPVEGERRTTVKRRANLGSPFEAGISEEEFKQRIGSRAEELLGGRGEVIERPSGARAIKYGSRDPSDWPSDVRDRVFSLMEGEYTKNRMTKETPEAFARRMLKGEDTQNRPASKQAIAYLDKYYAAAKKSEKVTKRPAEQVPPRGRVRETELESIGMSRKAVQKQEALPRQWDEFGIEPGQAFAGSRQGAGPAPFGAEQIPEGVRGTREPTTAKRSLARAWRFVDKDSDEETAVLKRADKAFKHPDLTQSMKQELIRSLNANAARDLSAVNDTLDSLSARIKKGRAGGAPTALGKLEAREFEALRAEELRAQLDQLLVTAPPQAAQTIRAQLADFDAAVQQKQFDQIGPIERGMVDVIRGAKLPAETQSALFNLFGQYFRDTSHRLTQKQAGAISEHLMRALNIPHTVKLTAESGATHEVRIGKADELLHDVFTFSSYAYGGKDPKNRLAGERAIYHESMHALLIRILAKDPALYDAIVDASREYLPQMKKVFGSLNEEGNYVYAESNGEEAVTHLFELWASGQIEIKGKSLVKNLFDWFKQLVDGFNNLWTGKLSNVAKDDVLFTVFDSFKRQGLDKTLASTTYGEVTREADRRALRYRDSINPIEREGLGQTASFIRQLSHPNAEVKDDLQQLARRLNELETSPDTTVSQYVVALNGVYDYLRKLDLIATKTSPAVEPKFLSQANTSGQRVPRGTMDQILNEIRRVLGDDIKVEWVDNLGHAGEAIVTENLEEIIRLATTGVDPMGHAHHEALHIMLERLKRLPGGAALVDRLIEATSTAAVRTRLEAMLEGNPGALRQLDDPTERLAYAYQLFRADPTFRFSPAAKTWFEGLKQFLRRIIGRFQAAELADRVFDAFAGGAFVDQMAMENWYTNRLNSALPDAWNETLQKNPIFTALNAIKSSGDAFMRETGIPAYVRLANLAQSGLGSSGGFLPERERISAQWGNRLDDIIGEQSEEALASAHRNLLLKKEPSNELERDLRKFLDDFYRYITKSGVERPVYGERGQVTWEKIPFRKNYYPGVWSPDDIHANRAAFNDLLKKHEYGKNDAERALIIENLLSGDGSEKYAMGDFETGFTPYMQSTGQRQLDRLYDDPDSLQFRNPNIVETLQRYIYQGTHRAEYVRQFGNRGEVLRGLLEEGKTQGATTEQQKWARMYMHAVEGTLGSSINPTLREAQGWMLLYQNLRLLPLSLFSQMIDPLNIVMRSGNFRSAIRAFTLGMKGVLGRLDPDQIQRMSRLVGVIDSKSALESIGAMTGSMYMSRTQRKISDTFFKAIGMTGWNNGIRLAAFEAAIEFLHEQTVTPGTHSARWLHELGLKPGDVQFNADGSIKLSPSPGFTKEQATRVRQGLNKWVNSTVMRPSAADRPIWMSNPYFALIGHLKQFTYSFSRNIIQYAWRETQHGNYWPLMVTTAYVPTMMAADFMRGMIQGLGEEPEYKKRWTAGDRAWNAVQRSGFTGVPQFAIDSMEDAERGQTGLETILGPSIAQTSEALRTLAGSREASAFFVNALPGEVVFKHW